jgi:amino acid transporter
LAWLLLAAANLSFAIGQISFLVITQVRYESLAFPSVVDAFYLVTYPIYAIGLLIFIRRRSTGHDRRSLVDALTVTVSLTMLSWLYLILPYVHNPTLSWPGCWRRAAGVPGPSSSSRSAPSACSRPTSLSGCCSCTARSAPEPRPTWAGCCSTPPGGPPRCTRA